MKKKEIILQREFQIYRKASQKDWYLVRSKRRPMKSSRTWTCDCSKLEMKISDIEFQGDGSKQRFITQQMTVLTLECWLRILQKNSVLVSRWSKVGFRQEKTARWGGIGSLGELCCSTWLTDFRSVNTSRHVITVLEPPKKLAGTMRKVKMLLELWTGHVHGWLLKHFPWFETN
jgi:hypothetical protein